MISGNPAGADSTHLRQNADILRELLADEPSLPSRTRGAIAFAAQALEEFADLIDQLKTKPRSTH